MSNPPHLDAATEKIPLPEQEPQQTQEQPAKHKKPSRRMRYALIALLVLVLLGAGGAVAGGFYLRSVEKGIERVDAFDGVPEQERPQKEATEARNILILGSDSRDPENTGGSRSDTLIVAHLPADRSSAQLISIPRDTWVEVPKSKDGKHGGTEAKINAAYAWGGVPLVVQTVEKFTGVRIDNVAIIDFAGFQDIVDAVGGVDIDVPQDFTSIHEPYRRFRAGVQHMDGATALDYARQRKQFPDGDFARIRHQQQVIKGVLNKAVSAGTLTNPGLLTDLIEATADAVSVDRTLSIIDTATEMSGLRGGDLSFMTNPTSGTGTVGTESVVFPDEDKTKQLYAAVKRDSVPDILKAAGE
ncbi:LCP family protein [Actinoplanes philippinensis]|uniref:LCP family protein n=1 Tax=Actinoplanes philippinensis TaxID=35752 RepID=UPI003F4CE18C